MKWNTAFQSDRTPKQEEVGLGARIIHPAAERTSPDLILLPSKMKLCRDLQMFQHRLAKKRQSASSSDCCCNWVVDASHHEAKSENREA
ncbi:hypothetical protein Ahy_A05g022041 isoform K [Arachis hypogaea]|uniref:Uncharacterized protein n=1 Tax=Arachis hypogaea TaxID=3818 RepID=A0A445CZG5_ARAHY|nr:hypothetical protein Ahy_A05g022041 isoform K [Arachis hypogaea]